MSHQVVNPRALSGTRKWLRGKGQRRFGTYTKIQGENGEMATREPFGEKAMNEEPKMTVCAGVSDGLVCEEELAKAIAKYADNYLAAPETFGGFPEAGTDTRAYGQNVAGYLFRLHAEGA
jgi:hypothetical protein